MRRWLVPLIGLVVLIVLWRVIDSGSGTVPARQEGSVSDTPHLTSLRAGQELLESQRIPHGAPSVVPQGSAATVVNPEASLPRLLQGRVVDATGQPIAGATVTRRLDRSSGFQDFDFGPRIELAVLDQVTTDGAGVFVFELPYAETSQLSARAKGFADAVREDCGAGQSVTLRLSQAAALKGWVTSRADGEGLAQVRVRVFHGSGGQVDSVITDNQGFFALHGLHPGAGQLQVIPREHAMPRLLDVELVAGKSVERSVQVEAGWVLSGQVRDGHTGAPIAGAEVSSWSFLGKTVHTDAQGFYRLAGARPRPGLLSARAPGFARNERVFSGPQADLDLELVPGFSIHGRVLDRAGQPLAGARVQSVGGAEKGRFMGREAQSVITAPNGRFTISHARTDMPLALSIRALGFGTAILAVPVPGEQTLDVKMGDLTLIAEASAAGRVEDSEGRPARGVAIHLTDPRATAAPPELEAFLFRRHTFTDEHGYFRVNELSPGTWAVRLIADGGQVVTRTLDIAPGEHRLGLVWQLPGQGRITGQVLAPGGLGLAGARVLLLGKFNLARTCDGAGEFSFENLSAGSYRLRASAPEQTSDKAPAGYALLPRTIGDLRPDGRHVEVRLLSADATIAGRVVDQNGASVPLAFVGLDTGDGSQPQGLLADENGHFQIAVHSARPVTLLGWRTGPLTSEGNISVQEHRLNRSLLGGKNAAGTLTDIQPNARDIVLRLSAP